MANVGAVEMRGVGGEGREGEQERGEVAVLVERSASGVGGFDGFR